MFVIFLVVILTALIASLVTRFVANRDARVRLNAAKTALIETEARLATSQAAYEARQGELRSAIDEARDREKAARADAGRADEQYLEASRALRTALEEKGGFEREAARVDEMRTVISERDAEIRSLNAKLLSLNNAKTEALKDAEAATALATELINKERESQQAVLRAKDEQLAKLNEFIAQARDVLAVQFKALSAEALRDVSEELANRAEFIIEKHGEMTSGEVEISKQHIYRMLKPIEETMKRLDRHLEEGELARTRAEALLDAQVQRLAGASESLSNALRKPVVRGSWGEMTLENVLESAGLQAGVDYVHQHYTDTEDGQRRTDAIINLPKGRKLIIDSKNLMETYIAFANAEEGPQKALLADTHSKSLRKHMKNLSTKEYWRRYDGLDCVILFIPHDGMYHAAIRDEAQLIRDSCEKRVFISNPMSLIPLLKAVRYVLDQERLNKSAEAISELGTELYGDLARFAGSVAKIGNNLKLTVAAYNDAIPGLDRFIVTKCRALKKLGSAKGSEAELPPPIEVGPRPFSSRELRASNPGPAQDYGDGIDP
jgi:DNA recombination protein RmuC